MLKIRLTRKGKKNKAFFRLVVAEHTSPIKGRFLEALGFFNPHTKEKKFEEDRIKYWIEKGAQCSDSAHNILVGAGIIKGSKRPVKIRKKEEAGEEAEKGEAKAETKEEEKNETPKKAAKAEEKPAAEAPVEEKKESNSKEEKKTETPKE